ncbi:MAG: tetratricopeptide repeat protein [bacterium]
MASAATDLCRAARRTGLTVRWDGCPGLGALLVAGPDAGTFLQAQLTSDVLGLGPGDAQPSARLLRNGAVTALVTLFRLPDRGQPFPSYLIIDRASALGSLKADLESFVIAEDVMIEEATAEFTGLVVEGPEADAMLEGHDLAADGAVMVPLSFTGDPGGILLCPPGGAGALGALKKAAVAKGFVDLDAEESAPQAWDWLRIEGGTLLAGPDFEPGKTLLPQTGLEQQVVSWTKGCYRGQEVVARVRTYGSVPRALRGLVIHEPLGIAPGSLPPAGSSLQTTEGVTIGTWASVGYSVVWDRPVALVYLDKANRAPGLRLDLEVDEVQLEGEVVLLPFHAAASCGEQANRLYDRAVRSFSAGADTSAIALLEQALRLDPHHTEAVEVLGVILGRTGRFHEAIDVFKRLEELAPDEPMVHTNLSLFYMRIGDKDEAERQKSLATLKKFGEGLSEHEIREREAREARERRADAERRRHMFAQVLEVDPEDPLALMGMGNAMLDLEDLAAAEEYLGRALEVQKDNSPLYVSRGKVLERLGRPDEAAAVYRRGVDVASRKGDLMPLKELEHRLVLLGRS